MPSPHTPKTQDEVTPKEFLEFIKFGTGVDFDRRACMEFIKEKGERGREILQQTRESIINLTGFEPYELLDIASKKTSPDEDEYDEFRKSREAIRRQLRETLPFPQKDLGDEANRYIEELVDKYLSGEESLKLEEEVKICNDAANLVIMAFNDKVHPRVKHAAAKKLLVMKFLGEIKNHSTEADDNALNYMMELYNERILEVPEGEKIGWTTPRYLVSYHEPVTYKTIRTKIYETKPTDIDENDLIQITEIPCRKTTVENKSNMGREIYFSIKCRKKAVNSRLTKALRYNNPIGEKDLDRNGIRKSFNNREDWDDFFRFYIATVKKQLLEDLVERLDDSINEIEAREVLERINNLDENIEIYDVKDSLGGNEFNGSAPSSSKDFKILKFKMKITQADGTIHQLEYQVFLPDGFADEKYRKGMSEGEYHVDRFFREGVDELLFPKKHYPQIDREKEYAKAMRQAHEKVWNGKAATPPPANR